ncbi:MAG: glycosyltransferase family 39 protein [Bacteroidota bacterium]
MIFYSDSTLYGLVIASIPGLVGLYFALFKSNFKLGLGLLLFSGFLMRMLMISLDPFLHDWDERYHALVAKNLSQYPFKPMLRVDPIMSYDMEAWCCNHIWVHKQPFFMWQMAISIFFFGTNEIAVRLPSALMGVISIYFIFQIAKYWTKNTNIAFLASFLFTFSYYQLELTAGRLSLEHNDLGFAFYVTAGIWAFTRYLQSEKHIKWSIIFGILIGCAILIKWLTGLLVFGGWGLYILLNKTFRRDLKRWGHITLAFIISVCVFLPWQLYILSTFPEEAAIMFGHNGKHIFEVLDNQVGGIWFHINNLQLLYGKLFWFILPFAFIVPFLKKNTSNKLTISFLTMIVVLYAFFSFVVKTKMPAYTFPVYSLMWILIAMIVYSGIDYLLEQIKLKEKSIVFLVLFLALGWYVLKPDLIAEYRAETNEFRNNKINNTTVFKTYPFEELEDRVILNCKGFEDTELMFYQNVNAYHWYPPLELLDSLRNEGHKFAAFQNVTNQGLPGYINTAEDIILIKDEIK